MIAPSMIANLFQTNYNVLLRQTDGLTHADSIIQPPFRGNCLNWVMGHIVSNRHRALTALNESPVWSSDDVTRYKRGSQPVTCNDDAFSWDKLMEGLKQTQDCLIGALNRATPDLMDTKVGEDETLGELLLFLAWHEGYHTGQTEYLRQLAGKNDAVIK